MSETTFLFRSCLLFYHHVSDAAYAHHNFCHEVRILAVLSAVVPIGQTTEPAMNLLINRAIAWSVYI